jgi:hypothetical protein
MIASPMFPDVHLPFLDKVELPMVMRVGLKHPSAPALVDVSTSVTNELEKSHRASGLSDGAKIAVAVGSRGIASIDQVVKASVNWLKAQGFSPFIVPAMGSHGGGTKEGQIEVLAALGITEQTMGVPIEATMDIVKYGTTSQGVDCVFDKNAAAADGVLAINRVKSHTSFDRPVESGLSKLVAVGLGKGQGAMNMHALGTIGLSDVLPEIAKISLRESPIFFGLALVENSNKQLVIVEGAEPEKFHEVDERLLKKAKSLLAKLPFDQIDALVVEELGKNISGAGMDYAVTGRTDIRGVDNPLTPFVHKLGVLGMTKEAKGNGIGIGMADYAPRDLANSLDLYSIYFNAVTATFMEKARLPIILPTDLDVFKACVSTCWVADPKFARLAIIKSTLHLNEILVSPNLFIDIAENENTTLIKDARPLEFSDVGTLQMRCNV